MRSDHHRLRYRGTVNRGVTATPITCQESRRTLKAERDASRPDAMADLPQPATSLYRTPQ